MKLWFTLPCLIALITVAAQEGASLVQDEDAHSTHTFTVAFKRFADGELLVTELYPNLKAKGLEKERAVEIKGTYESVERVGALLGELDKLREDEKWALLSIPHGVASAGFANLLKAETGVSTHAGKSQVLVFGGRKLVDDSCRVALTMLESVDRSATVESKGLVLRRSDIEKSVRAEFEARQKVHRAELELLKSKLAEFEARLKTYEESKELMIRKRIDEVMKDPSLGAVTQSTDVSSKKSKSTGPYKVQAGDTLGILIPQVLGQEGEQPPIHKDPTGRRGPVMGYPISVRDDGTISVPYVPAQKVVGLSIRGVEAKLVHAYTVENEVLRKGSDVVLVSLIRSVDDSPIPVPRNATTGQRLKSISLSMPLEMLGRYREFQKQFQAAAPGSIEEQGVRDAVRLLKEEHRLTLQIVDQEIQTLKATVDEAREQLAFTKRLVERGYGAPQQVLQAKSKVGEAVARLEEREGFRDLLAKVEIGVLTRETNRTGRATSSGANAEIKIGFEDTPWEDVVEQLAQAIGKRLIKRTTVPGKVTLQSDRALSPLQARDFVNAELIGHGVLLLENKYGLLATATAGGVPQSFIYEVSELELSRSYQDIDFDLLSIKFRNIDDVRGLADEIDALLDPQPFVSITALESAGTIFVTALSRDLRRVAEVVDAARRRGTSGAAVSGRSSISSDGRVQILKTPSEFADKFVELEDLIQHGKGNARRNALTRFKALQAEYDLQLSLIQAELKAVVSRADAANIAHERVLSLRKSRPGSAGEVEEKRTALTEAKARYEQIGEMLSAYRAIRPKKSSQAKKAEAPQAGLENDSEATARQLNRLAQITPLRPDADIDPVADEVRPTLLLGKDNKSWMIANGENQLLRRFLDTTGNNVVDRREFFKGGKLTYAEMDKDGDKKFERFEFYRDGKLVRTLLDTDGDGNPDEQSDSGQ